MSEHLAWYLARASAIVAWALVSASVVWGLLVSIRLTRRPSPRWLLDLHRFLGGTALVFTAVHVAALVADNVVHFDLLDVLVPFASSWEPAAVAVGVVAAWLLVAVEITSLLMRHLPRRAWRAVHLASYGMFWLATIHGVVAGTDATHPLFWWSVNLTTALVVFLTVVRVLLTRGARRPARGAGASAARPAGSTTPPAAPVATPGAGTVRATAGR